MLWDLRYSWQWPWRQLSSGRCDAIPQKTVTLSLCSLQVTWVSHTKQNSSSKNYTNRYTLYSVLTPVYWNQQDAGKDRSVYEETGVRFLARARDFFFFTASRLALGPTQAPIQWVQRVSSTEEKHLELQADCSCHLMLNLRMRGAVPPLPHVFMLSS
jgi:hypothetical protein